MRYKWQQRHYIFSSFVGGHLTEVDTSGTRYINWMTPCCDVAASKYLKTMPALIASKNPNQLKEIPSIIQNHLRTLVGTLFRDPIVWDFTFRPIGYGDSFWVYRPVFG
jgi:hypothetical protein